MWKGVTTIVTLLITGASLLAQKTVLAQIMDSQTNEPLPYVNIGIQGTNLGTVSNDDGEFELQTKSNQDVLVFSYVGYESKKIVAHSLETNGHILLKPISLMVPAIEISSSIFDNELILGVRNEDGRGHAIGFGNAQLGTELGALISIEKETLIKSLNFVLIHAQGDSLLLRINIYDYEDGVIGEKVLLQNIYVKDKQRSGAYTVDMEGNDLLLINDVLLSVEWLRDFDETGNKGITFDTKKSKKLGGTFIRYSKTGEFSQVPYKRKYKPCIYFVGKQSSK